MDKKENLLSAFESWLENIVGKLPTLPDKAAMFLVKILPWAAILMMVVLIPMTFFALLAMLLMPIYFWVSNWQSGILAAATTFLFLTNCVLMLTISPGLFKRKIAVWRVLLWMTVINGILSFLSVNLTAMVLWTLVPWYLLFQIKKFYT